MWWLYARNCSVWISLYLPGRWDGNWALPEEWRILHEQTVTLWHRRKAGVSEILDRWTILEFEVVNSANQYVLNCYFLQRIRHSGYDHLVQPHDWGFSRYLPFLVWSMPRGLAVIPISSMGFSLLIHILMALNNIDKTSDVFMDNFFTTL